MKESPKRTRERGILFSPDLAQKVHLGLKTVTRRLVKPQPTGKTDGEWISYLKDCPYGEPGDLLYVRETFAPLLPDHAEDDGRIYDAENPEFGRSIRDDELIVSYRGDPNNPGPGSFESETGDMGLVERWKPSIHMPKWAARTRLKIKSVRVERIRDISKAAMIAEGFQMHPNDPWHVWQNWWGGRWNERYPGSWDRNDWVWVVEFEKVDRP